MAAPLVHLAAMEQARALITTQMGIPVNAGTKVDVVEADISGPHAGWDVISSSGDLFDKLQVQFQDLKTQISASGKNPNQINVPAFSRTLRFICHFCTDTHTLGHISAETAPLENRLEPAGELVWGKKDLPVVLNTYASFDTFRSALIPSMRAIYDVYHIKAKSWWFLSSGDFRTLIRKSVKYGGEFTASLAKLAWDQV
jgi:hypothetical protein